MNKITFKLSSKPSLNTRSLLYDFLTLTTLIHKTVILTTADRKYLEDPMKDETSRKLLIHESDMKGGNKTQIIHCL